MEQWRLTWKLLWLKWEEAEKKEKKEKRFSIRLTETQVQLLRDISFKAGFEDSSSYIRYLIRKDLEERAEHEDKGETQEMAWY